MTNSSAEAEIIVLSYALNMSILSSAMMVETIMITSELKNNIKVDNKAAILATKASYSINLRYMKKTQRLSIARLNEILFCANNINCSIEYVNTKDNVADMFTKALDYKDFVRHLESLGMKEFHENNVIVQNTSN